MGTKGNASDLALRTSLTASRVPDTIERGGDLVTYREDNPIVIDPEVKGGTPVFAGTRVPVHTLFRYLEHGTLEEYLDEFRTVRRDQAVHVLALAERALLSGVR